MPAFEWETNTTRDTFQFVRQNTKHKKDKQARIERKEIWKKVREIGWIVLIFT